MASKLAQGITISPMARDGVDVNVIIRYGTAPVIPKGEASAVSSAATPSAGRRPEQTSVASASGFGSTLKPISLNTPNVP